MIHNERLLTEQQNIRKNRKYMFYALPSPDKPSIWECGFPGPDNELYKNSYFTVTLTFPKNYPMAPPRVKFCKPVFHPNIYTNGEVCLDIIQSKWKPSMTAMSILSSLQNLLEYPNIKSPANPEAGFVYSKDPSKYEETVRKYIELYNSKPVFRRQ